MLLLERGEGTEKEGEKHLGEREASICLPLVCALTGDRTLNLGMCPDRGSNL